jgi:THO complex subunit 2
MESLSARRDEACRILSEAWNMTLNDSAHCSDFQHVLLDSLWLLSSSLTEVTATSTQQDMATANEQDSPPNVKSKVAPHFQQQQQQQQHPLGNPSMDALLFIITSLLQASETIAKSQPKSRESFAVGLQSNLNPSLLEKLLGFNSSSSVKTNDDLMKRLRMYNTQVNYKQHKYNLLQEESEGYAKVLQFLHLQPTETNNGEDEDRSIGHLQHLVGSFELDPNRVLELAVDALEQELHATSITDGATWNAKENHPCVRRLVSIIQTFPMNKLASIISFRLQKSAPDEGVTAEDTMEFYATVAFLVQEGAVDLPTLMRYLNPVEDEIENAYKAYWIKEKGKILALTRISLTGGTNSKDDPKQAENLEKYERLVKPLEENPTLIIVLSLIESGNWRLVKPMFSDESWSCLCCLMPQTFGCAMCDVAENVVDEWFGSHRNSKLQSTTSGARGTVYNGKRHSESDGIEKVEEGVIGFVESLWDPLSSVVRSGCISDRPTLFCNICRILKRLLENVKDVLDFGYGASSCVYDFLSKFLVPSNSLFPSNPAVSTELWLVLQQLPYPIRYTMYSEWKGMGLGRGGMSSMAGGKPLPNVLSEVETGKAARYVLKRLSKENIRDMSRQLAKVTHANPLVVYATILDQIESYDNMVEVMVEAQRFVSPLGLDVLGYCILGRLSGSTGGVNRSRLKGTDIIFHFQQNLSHLLEKWFVVLSDFCVFSTPFSSLS